MDHHTKIGFNNNQGIYNSTLSLLIFILILNLLIFAYQILIMKNIILSVILMAFYSISFSQDAKKTKLVFDSKKETYQVEAACGVCIFKMKGDGCKLAIRMKGKDYFVDGTGIDDYGDAHDQEGFCNASSPANIQGKIIGERFLATYMELVKKEEKK